jgi:hypothetical protein
MYATARLVNARTLLSALALLLVMSVAYAFAATNVVPTSGAGDGAGAISGYTVSDIDYLLTDGTNTDPSTIDRVTFTLADTADGITVGQPRDVQVSLVNGGAFYSCTTTGWSVSCPVTGGVLVTAANELRVIAAE